MCVSVCKVVRVCFCVYVCIVYDCKFARVWVCVTLFVCWCKCPYGHVYIGLRAYVLMGNMWVHVCMYDYVCVFISASMCMDWHVCTHVRMCVYVSLYV